MQTKVFTFGNQKGGVGKTTSTINQAHWFALNGKKVLILDLDGQGHIGTTLGVGKANGLYQLLVQEKLISEIAIHARKNLDVVLNDHTCELVKEHIKQANFREYILNNVLEEARESYDVIFIDTPPSTDVLHVLALVASDFLIIPANMDFLALDGVSYILKTLQTISHYPGVESPVLVGVMPTLFDKTTSETMNNIRQLQENIGKDWILPPIPRDTHIREASSHGQTIWEYDPKSHAAVGYEGVSSVKNSQGKIGGYLHIAEILNDLLDEG